MNPSFTDNGSLHWTSEIRLEHDFGAIVEADECPHLLRTVAGAKSEISEFGAAEFCG